MYRSHTCGELIIDDVKKEVILAGWVQTVRKFGAITFVDLRDRYGITQLLFGEELNNLLDTNPLGREFVIQATGIVAERSNKNANIATGEIEITVKSFRILNRSAVPPFTIQDDTDGGDDVRMKYRFLDLRRNAIKKNLELRYAVGRSTRNYLQENILINSDLYEAEENVYQEIILSLDNSIDIVFIFGHNPTISRVISQYGSVPYVEVPTCSVSVLKSEKGDWKESFNAKFTLSMQLFPKLLLY